MTMATCRLVKPDPDKYVTLSCGDLTPRKLLPENVKPGKLAKLFGFEDPTTIMLKMGDNIVIIATDSEHFDSPVTGGNTYTVEDSGSDR